MEGGRGVGGCLELVLELECLYISHSGIKILISATAKVKKRKKSLEI